MGTLDFGECSGYYHSSTHVNLNGVEIGMAFAGHSKTIEINFQDGDILELKEGPSQGRIKFNGFTINSCC